MMTQTILPAARPARGQEPRPALLDGDAGIAYPLSAIAAMLLAITSLGGLVFGTRGLYQPDPFVLPQFLAQDMVGLVLVLPLLLSALRFARRGSLRGLLLWAALLFYIVYWYYFYVVGVQFGPLFLVHIALVSTSAFALLVLLARLDVSAIRERFAPEVRTRLIGGFLGVMGALFLLLWIGDITRRLVTGEPVPEVSRHVYVIDLTLMLPLSVGVGLSLWRRSAWGFALAGLVLVKVVGTMLMLLTSTMLLLSWGQAVSAGETVAYAVTLILALACTTLYFRAVRS